MVFQNGFSIVFLDKLFSQFSTGISGEGFVYPMCGKKCHYIFAWNCQVL